MLKIGILEGDDIGLEVVPEAVKVMKAAAAKTGLQVEWIPLPLGRKAHETHGHTMPDVTVEALKSVDGWLQGPIGHNAYPRHDPPWINPPLRKRFELFGAQGRGHCLSARSNRRHAVVERRVRGQRRIPSQ